MTKAWWGDPASAKSVSAHVCSGCAGGQQSLAAACPHLVEKSTGRCVRLTVNASSTHSQPQANTDMCFVLRVQGGNLALAKQHYRRALQKVPQGFTTRTYLQLGHCFMASGDARAAADTYTTCISVATSAAAAAAHTTPATATAPTATAPGDAAGWPATASWWGQSGSGAATAVSVSVLAPCVAERLVPGCCTSVWLALALAYTRLGDSRAAELALSEGNLCDSEHPGVWGHLALLALQQVCAV
jgi:Tfp pilus assembly protein PilF